MTNFDNSFDADGYYRDTDGEHLVLDDLTIFRAQYNIGRRIVETVQKADILNLKDNQKQDGKRKFQDINMLFLGPTYKTLRDQTRKDLGNFLQERVQLSYTKIETICKSCVLNNSSIPNNYEAMHFIKVFRQNPFDYLHVLVFDEAHWGINNAGIIDKFFQYFVNLRKQIIVKQKSKPLLIVLLVSATIDVLTRVINLYEDETQRVDWSKLRRHEIVKFGTPEYRDIFDLHLYNDKDPHFLKLSTLIERSEVVAAEYKDTIKICLESVLRLESHSWDWTAAWEALRFLFPGSRADEIAARARAADYPPKDNYMVLLRLQANDHIIKLHKDILEIFQIISTKLNIEFQPFEVIQFIQDSDSILNQLSPKALRHLRLKDQTANDTLEIGKLNNLPCLILVNDKLGMGERLPSTCMAFDVRSRYKGDIGDMQGFASTFIQDIGRCCGHRKPKALILMSMTDKAYQASGKTDKSTLEDVQFHQLHRLLDKKQLPTAAHPERNSKVFSELSSCSIILDAEPQIGKTGAIMAMLDILYSEHTLLAKTPAVPSMLTKSQLKIRKSNTLEEITAELCAIVNDSDESLNARIQKLLTTLDTNNLFHHYHNMIDNFKEAKALLEAIYNNNLIAPMNSARKAKQRVFSIVDCGCGLHGILHMFRLNSSDLDLPVRIIGIDLHKSILQLQQNNSFPNVTFIGHVGDMASTDHTVIKNAPFNVVLYSCSLFENDITRHINWANKQLQMGGMLIIADVVRRFPDNFETTVQNCGFKCRIPYKICDIFQVWPFEKDSNNTGELQIINLRPY